MSQRRLAFDLGISPAYLCQVEKGERPPLDEERTLRASKILDLVPQVVLAAALVDGAWPAAGRYLRDALGDMPERLPNQEVRQWSGDNEC